MSFKLNNRLVHHGTSRNSTFLLVFSKVHEIRSLKQSTILDAWRCSLVVTACIFQRRFILATLWIFLVLKLASSFEDRCNHEHLQAPKTDDCFRLRISWTFEKTNKKVQFRLIRRSTSRLFNLISIKSPFWPIRSSSSVIHRSLTVLSLFVFDWCKLPKKVPSLQ